MGHNKKSLCTFETTQCIRITQKQQIKSINQRTGNGIIEFQNVECRSKQKRRTATDLANWNGQKDEGNMTNIWHKVRVDNPNKRSIQNDGGNEENETMPLALFAMSCRFVQFEDSCMQMNN